MMKTVANRHYVGWNTKVLSIESIEQHLYVVFLPQQTQSYQMSLVLVGICFSRLTLSVVKSSCI